ncbi:MAG: PhoH family protein [Gammaproteobacteria bacterium]|nr:PhoH family protein [Acholeplasmataceae bacterium]MCK9528959.1 PhoH family protein [Gammaproteobacteria bacterium]
MSRLVRKQARAKKNKAQRSTRSSEYNREVELEVLAQEEYQQNKRRFFKLSPRNANQGLLIENMRHFRLNFVLGPAGCGKTFVATLFACDLLERNIIEKIVVTRPMVGCDEDYGFVPGTEAEKYSGWVGPVMEVLEGYFGKTRVQNYLNMGKIAMKPLMNMRGSTFRNSFVILDEAQNTTVGQMKMFLTRIGEGSSIIVNGDMEQSDLPRGVSNGLSDAYERLQGSQHLGVVEFTENDIVRDPLVREILKAYRK